jgi:hypothetical protein
VKNEDQWNGYTMVVCSAGEEPDPKKNRRLESELVASKKRKTGSLGKKSTHERSLLHAEPHTLAPGHVKFQTKSYYDTPNSLHA